MRDLDLMQIYSVTSVVALVVMGVFPILLLAGAMIYIILRMRDAKSERHDPQLGVKVALHYLMTVSIILLVVGASVVIVDQLMTAVADDPFGSSDSEFFTETTKFGLGLVLAGTLLAAGEWWLIFSRTNDRKWPATRRTFNGLRTLLHGLIVTASLAGILVVGLLDFGGGGSAKERLVMFFLGLLIVWGISLAIHMTLLFLYSRQANVPGENFYCFECGDDLRGKVTNTTNYCPTCKAALPLAQKRSFTTPQGPAAPTPPTAGIAFPPPTDKPPPNRPPSPNDPAPPGPPA